MTEKQLERLLQTKIKSLGGLALKFTSPNYTGVPDRILLMPKGNIYFVELKSKGEKLRKRQIYVKSQFEKLGHRVFIIDDRESLDKLIKELGNA